MPRATDPIAIGDVAAAPSGAVEAQAGYKTNGVAHDFFWDYQSLLAALRQCRERRDISCERLDEIAGLPKGLASKILSPHGERKITLQNLTWILAGLGVRCQLVDDADLLRQINGRMVARDAKVVRSGAVTFTLSRRFFAKIGRKGANSYAALTSIKKRRKEAYMENLTAEQRSRIARKAALARWHGRATTGGR